MPKADTQSGPGRIVSFFAGVARVTGLPRVFLHEVLCDHEDRPRALVIGFNQDYVEALFFTEEVDPALKLFRRRKSFELPVSETIVGRVLDGLGRPRDGLGPLYGSTRPVFATAPPIIEREPVTTPLSTGIKIIDTTLPLGRGQRELIIGDRKLGKSTLAVDIVLNQKEAQPPIFCVYVLCGQKEQKRQRLLNLLQQHNALLYTTVVAATARSSLAEIYLAPFVGCALGEYFRDRGQDALVIYDDLSQHAQIYRDIALLLRRAPGREAYPGDIFSLHAQLLERAGKLSGKKGGGSLTALPLIETQQGDITAFIPTNLISITDGQIYFERGLFQKGFYPAVNVGLSVSRVGSRAQPAALKEVTAGLRLALAQHRQLQKLAQLETAKSRKARREIQRGELLLELLKQEKHTRVSWEEQAVLFYVVEAGFFDDLAQEEWRRFEELFRELLKSRYFDLLEEVKLRGFSPHVRGQIQTVVADFKEEFFS